MIEKKNLSIFFFLFCFNSTLLEYYGVEIASGFSSSTLMGFGGIFCVLLKLILDLVYPALDQDLIWVFALFIRFSIPIFVFFSLLCTEHYLNLEKGSILFKGKLSILLLVRSLFGEREEAMHVDRVLDKNHLLAAHVMFCRFY